MTLEYLKEINGLIARYHYLVRRHADGFPVAGELHSVVEKLSEHVPELTFPARVA